jgi:hypothetical protein
MKFGVAGRPPLLLRCDRCSFRIERLEAVPCLHFLTSVFKIEARLMLSARLHVCPGQQLLHQLLDAVAPFCLLFIDSESGAVRTCEVGAAAASVATYYCGIQ